METLETQAKYTLSTGKIVRVEFRDKSVDSRCALRVTYNVENMEYPFLVKPAHIWPNGSNGPMVESPDHIGLTTAEMIEAAELHHATTQYADHK